MAESVLDVNTLSAKGKPLGRIGGEGGGRTVSTIMLDVEFDDTIMEGGSISPDCNALFLRREGRCYAE